MEVMIDCLNPHEMNQFVPLFRIPTFVSLNLDFPCLSNSNMDWKQSVSQVSRHKVWCNIFCFYIYISTSFARTLKTDSLTNFMKHSCWLSKTFFEIWIHIFQIFVFRGTFPFPFTFLFALLGYLDILCIGYQGYLIDWFTIQSIITMVIK